MISLTWAQSEGQTGERIGKLSFWHSIWIAQKLNGKFTGAHKTGTGKSFLYEQNREIQTPSGVADWPHAEVEKSKLRSRKLWKCVISHALSALKSAEAETCRNLTEQLWTDAISSRGSPL
ncbi:hypothetical protein [Salipiger sp. CCB-MM3]|uniref:hypothetical protein n=1 Tax=Salipiger sp. CCB-MM3 TaxID=1792508 RepID=UPI00187DA513|nr:hypothetical protein [Salipiger sp. CCB-MM3]